ncbi:MAG TPA: efflux RND transporter periplasmic adaptor subunit [Vicinamibacterales bacterium]|nr:efflux RND transporter periplasmic adaptor subunit [Vicinamibacterales bacterium]
MGAVHALFPPRGGRRFLALVALVSLAACSKEEAAPPPVVTVQTATAARASISQVVTADAVLYPLSQAAIVPKVSAPVERFLVQRGAHVKKGQVLAILEHKDLQAARDQARGAYDQARANDAMVRGANVPAERQKAQLDVDTAKTALDAQQKIFDDRQMLVKEGALAQRDLQAAQVALAQARSTYDQAVQHLESLNSVSQAATLQQADAQLASAKGQYEAAEAQLSYATIESPIDGVVADRPLYAGEMASAGTPLLTVMDTSSVIARAPVPQEQAAGVAVGDAGTISVPGVDEPIEGRVTVVSPALDPSSTTEQVWLQVPNRDGALKPGTSVRVAIVARTVAEATVVPAAAIVTDSSGGKSVMVVGSDHKAHAQPVELGITRDEQVQITKGLQPGETIVTTGAFGLEDGTRVQVEAKPPTPSAGADKDEK